MTEAMNAYRSGDYAAAAGMLRPWAEQGNMQAQYHLGTMYTIGQGVALDYTTGVVWLRKAADQGSPRAAETLGNLYVSGLGVARDEAEAVRWFQRAAELNDGKGGDCD
jgi:TPR repeat protein